MLTRSVNKRTFYSRVKKLHAQWISDFLDCCKSGKIYPYIPNNKTFVQDHIEFIRRYIGFLFLDGETEWNLERIKRFLSMQTRFSDPATTELRFAGGIPIEVITVIETLNDIDLSDVHCILKYNKIFVSKFGRSRWTSKNITSFLGEIEEDISYDGTKVILRYILCSSRELIIECEVEE